MLVVSGLPATAKARWHDDWLQIWPAAMALPLLDKDDILEHLFDAQGIGDSNWRRGLSTESNCILQSEALASHDVFWFPTSTFPGCTSRLGPRHPGQKGSDPLPL
jgi:hypothetical protein